MSKMLRDVTSIFPLLLWAGVSHAQDEFQTSDQDAFIFSGASTSNYGSSTSLACGVDGGSTYLSYLRFPLALDKR